MKDRAHFYVGYERVDRELQQDRVVTVTPANAAALGLQPPPGFIPASQLTNFFIVRPDWKINANQELFGRYTLFTNNSPNNIGGGLNTLERSIDFKDNIQTGNAQLISILSPKLLNEFRFQYSRRNQPSVLNDLSGQGPSITVSGVAQFGAPAATDGRCSSTNGSSNPRQCDLEHRRPQFEVWRRPPDRPRPARGGAP